MVRFVWSKERSVYLAERFVSPKVTSIDTIMTPSNHSHPLVSGDDYSLKVDEVRCMIHFLVVEHTILLFKKCCPAGEVLSCHWR